MANTKTLKITLVKSPIGAVPKQRATAESDLLLNRCPVIQ